VKKDASRDTFHAEKHYRLVLMQQGRVQLDSDWNEQGEIIDNRVETETQDVVGLCGAPIDDAGLEISVPASGPDFRLGAGRFYVDGLLCINETTVSYTMQPDFPSAPPIVDEGLYLIYLDVWQRHITALVDPSIREVALGGPDTATRSKTVWQVKFLSLGAEAKGTCATRFEDFDNLKAPPTGTLTARARKEQTSTSPCIVPPGAGYRGLENQLYRVEVHDAGSALDVAKAAAPFPVTRVANTTNQVNFTAGTWQPGQAVEFISTSSKNPMNGSLAHVVAVDGGAKKLTLDVDVSGFDFQDVRLRPVGATFKWSRDNGSVVTAIENISGVEITVHDLGPDDVLGFDVGQWVEVVDDVTDLNGRPGVLAQIVKKDKAINLLTLNVAPPPLPIKDGKPDLSAHPLLRRWDGIGAVKFEQPPVDNDDLELENGVLVRFGGGTYRNGDYWTIPARTATADARSGNIEWPSDASGNPLAQPRFGIAHHFCRLAMLHWNKTKFDRVDDCRHLFPPLTELTIFVYISGDGQEAMPNQPLGQPLEAGVFNGRVPVKGAPVVFVAQDNGRVGATTGDLAGATNTFRAKTGADGIASCFWRLDPDVSKPSQIVTASWRDADDNVLAAIPFNGNLSIADQVFYDPANCKALSGQTTVQKAIRQLSQLVSLYELSGNDQIIAPGGNLELVVLAASRCGPVGNRKVQFRVVAGNGKVAPETTVTLDDGTAKTTWTPDGITTHQIVEATLVDEPANSTAAPTTVPFTANISAQQERGIHIKEVTAGRAALDNDTVVAIDQIQSGITITTDTVLDPISAGPAPDPRTFPDATPEKPSCFVTIDLPYPLDRSAQEFWGQDQIVGFQPLIVACHVEVQQRQLIWKPTRIANQWLGIVFSRLKVTDRLLAHLTAKGNFIFSAEKPLIHLDGEGFGKPSRDGRRIDVALPSGDGRTGGDFEMWFWLAPAKTNATIAIDPAGFANRQVRGKVLDPNGAALPGQSVTLTGAIPTFRPPPAVTGADGSFTFTGVPAGSYQLSVVVNGVTTQQPVTF
jgi:uncharacterized protein DUF6519/carboxypeptidase family protein